MNFETGIKTYSQKYCNLFSDIMTIRFKFKTIIIYKILFSLLFPAVIIIIGLGEAFSQDCEIDGPNGEWIQISPDPPPGWDGVYVFTNIIGNSKYKVDWCGWRNNKENECNANCKGDSSAFGTIFFNSTGVKPCKPESAKIYQWVCGNCTNQHLLLGKTCGGKENIAFFDNANCTGSCVDKSFGMPPEDQCSN